MLTYAIDYETFYDSEYGIEECGLWGYLHDSRFDPYLVSIVGPGIEYVGHPSNAPWDKLIALSEPWMFVSHNFTFDKQVHARAIELGIIPAEAMPTKWRCTANMSVYLGGPRSLKDACKFLLGIDVNKEMRNYMRGKTWLQAVTEGMDGRLKQYALDDSKYCLQLWTKYNAEWPEIEQECAELTMQQTLRGVFVDTKLLDEALPKVLEARAEALKGIPWAGTVDDKGKEVKPLSGKALKDWCAENNVPVPSTTEAKSPEFIKWQEDNKDVTVVSAMQTFRSTNAAALKATVLRRRVNDIGRFNFDMKYFGASTGRWSAGYDDDHADSSGFNIQNIYSKVVYGLDLRRAIIASPGKKFVISDYSQIEPRCLAWLCKDQSLIDKLDAGQPLYEAHARSSMGWTGGNLKKENPKLYALAKARVLALGYGAGWAKFIAMATMYGAADCLLEPINDYRKDRFIKYLSRTNQMEKVEEFTEEKQWVEAVNAHEIVQDFRQTNPLIAGDYGIWKMLERDCTRCVGTSYKVELPSGRILPYFDVKKHGGLTVRKSLDGMPIRIWGGFLTENVTQATARDVMRDACLNLEKEGICTLFSVHDEIICEVDRNFDPKIIRDIMNITPPWMPGLPLDISQEETDYYKK